MPRTRPSPERWAPAPERDGIEVSTLGQVRQHGHLLTSQRLGRQAVVYVDRKPIAVAVLVAEAFPPEPAPKPKRAAPKPKPERKEGDL